MHGEVPGRPDDARADEARRLEEDARTRTISFTIPGEPIAKGRPKATTIGGFARMYTPQTTVRYEHLVKLAFVEEAERTSQKRHAHGFPTMTFPVANEMVEVEIVFGLPIPKSMPNWRRALALDGSLAPITKPDLTNLAKSVEDGLNGVAFVDDSQIVELTLRKKYTDSPSTRVTLRYLPLPPKPTPPPKPSKSKGGRDAKLATE